MTPEVVTPFVETGDAGGVGLLGMDQHHVIHGITVEAAHGLEVLCVFLAVKELLDTFLNARRDLPQPVFAALVICHSWSPFIEHLF